MLVWLVDRLLEAEAAGEKVHILSHVPPGNAECLGAWGREYSRIITRYESCVICVMCHVSYVMCYVLYVIYHVSYVIYHAPCVMFHVSCVICHESCVMFQV